MRTAIEFPPGAQFRIELLRLESHTDFLADRFEAASEMRRRRELERSLASPAGATFPARCWVCGRGVDFRIAPVPDLPAGGAPNWREELVCPVCQLSNRMRASIQLFHELLAPSRDANVYLTEQETGTFLWFADNYSNVIGSEYLGDSLPLGLCNERGVRNEKLEALTLIPASQDFVLCFDVLEHLPDFRLALRECHRVLRSDGSLLLTVPFLVHSQRGLLRATIDPTTSEIRYLLEPEIHFDPQRPTGALAYHTFGWDLLDQLREIGFADVCGYRYWSEDWGYLGDDLMLFVARKHADGADVTHRDAGQAEARVRAELGETIRRLRSELLRRSLDPTMLAVRSAEEGALRQRLAIAETRLSRAYASVAGLEEQLCIVRGRLRELEQRSRQVATSGPDPGYQDANIPPPAAGSGATKR